MNPFPREFFDKQDPGDDALFYTMPRLVVHIDEHAIAALTDAMRSLLPPGGVYLDLMSSWRSHLPPDMHPARVVGLGMNAEEMAQNPQLDKYVVHDLNQQPALPYEDNLFDAVICTVSVQYLQRPIDVFREVYRALKPGGVFVVSFSNRCFPTKAVAIWLSTDDQEHIALVGRYFRESGDWQDLTAQSTDPATGYPRGADPLYIVHARKPVVNELS
jgi:SAM-dependent methyltransferase